MKENSVSITLMVALLISLGCRVSDEELFVGEWSVEDDPSARYVLESDGRFAVKLDTDDESNIFGLSELSVGDYLVKNNKITINISVPITGEKQTSENEFVFFWQRQGETFQQGNWREGCLDKSKRIRRRKMLKHGTPSMLGV